jgi:hypothetical protein
MCFSATNCFAAPKRGSSPAQLCSYEHLVPLGPKAAAHPEIPTGLLHEFLSQDTKKLKRICLPR